MGQAASATSEALKSVKTTLGEERFSEVRQDAESLLAKPNPTETFSNKLHLSLDLTQTLIANISVKLLDKPSTEISLAIYAHLASVSSLGSRQDRMELVWMCMTAADERVGVEMLLPKLTQIVQSGYKQSGFQATEDDCALLVKACLTENELDCYKFQKLGSAHPSLQFVTDHVFASLRYTNVPLDAASVKLPQPSRLLTIPMLSVINASLPKHCRDRWQRLFSTTDDGQSFASFMGAIAKAGACVLVLEDESGHVFGGFASQPWTIQPAFYGKDNCFVFSCTPSLQLHFASGLNSNFQYCNQGMQTLPNGLGMGGQLEYFALFVNNDLLTGHCRGDPSTTFRNPRLSAQETFKIVNLEAWLVGLPDENGPAAQRSILDGRETDTAILEMAGRKMHSQGLREPHPEDDESDDDK
eukprot:TRINITY_DN10322_c0_g1_i7.p1 TRINITY_DN10322_c0_g1~~TRINITY_DN10322_c0_g1_i7.p1  ORF type:complete len:414 (+),score=85.47 TRINITY_DN10322_c0_g1_i7:101-1342(+)